MSSIHTQGTTLIVSSLIGDRGGAEKVAVDLAKWLHDCGRKTVILTTASCRKSQGWKTKNGVQIYYMYCPNIYWVGDAKKKSLLQKMLWQIIDTCNWFVYFKALKFIKENDVDIVHVHKLRGFSPVIWLAAKSAKIKLVIQTCHDYELLSPIANLKGQIHDSFWNLTIIRSLYHRVRLHLSRSVDVVTAPSKYTLEKIMTYGFFPTSRKEIVPNSHGFSKNSLRSFRVDLKSNCHNKNVKFLYLGRLEYIKGVDILCEAFANLALSYDDIQLDIIGEGELTKPLINKFGDQSRMHFRGAIFGDARNEFICNADWIIIPSAWEEVFGIVAIEAFAFGTPVIAAEAGGLPEVVNSEDRGIIVAECNVIAFVDALSRARKQVLINGKMAVPLEVAEEYSAESIQEKYLQIYSL